MAFVRQDVGGVFVDGGRVFGLDGGQEEGFRGGAAAGVGVAVGGGGGEEDGAGHAGAGVVAAESFGAVFFKLARLGVVVAVDVVVDDGVPGGGQHGDESAAAGGVVQGDVARHDEGFVVVVVPEVLDYGGHEFEDAAGLLEIGEGAPLGVELAEEFGVERVGVLELVAVVGGGGFGGEGVFVFAVPFGDFFADVVALVWVDARE